METEDWRQITELYQQVQQASGDQAAIDAQLDRLEQEQATLESIVERYEKEVKKNVEDGNKPFAAKTEAEKSRQEA
jgi:hypothetical protein